MNSYFVRCGIVAVMMVTTISSQEPRSETIQAQAFGTATMAGRTFNLTILIEDYSTPADQKALIDAFNKGGHDELVKTLSKMPSKGRVSITGGGVGYQVAYIRNIPTENGRTVRLLTDRPINIGEAYASTRSRDYDLSVIELKLSNDKDKSSGTLIPGGRVKMNKKKKEVVLETYHAMPWRLAGIMER